MRNPLSRFVAPVALLVAFACPVHADDSGPSRISSLSVGTGKTTAALLWTAGGGDCTSGDALTYEIRRSTSNITDTNWQSAAVVASGSADTNGSTQCQEFSSLSCNTTYYWVVFTFDSAGNRSPLGNVVSAAQKSCGTFAEVACP